MGKYICLILEKLPYTMVYITIVILMATVTFEDVPDTFVKKY